MRRSYPSDISKEQFEKIRKGLTEEKRERIPENMIYMTYFAQFCIC